MNTSRITVSLPDYTYQNLVRIVPVGQISRFVTEAVEQKMASAKSVSDPVAQFLEAGDNLPRKNTAAILAAIEKGRL
ncbi:hypothetical protein HZB78_03430 [Candidatus Collierbacteria bacterium]|nr:hypothetical protein [Candidatus Collierbacteria bacterium]